MGTHCYFLTPKSFAYTDVYDGPKVDTEQATLVRAAWEREPCGKLSVVGAHLAMFETVEELDAVSSALFNSTTLVGTEPWVAAGAPWQKDLDVTDKSVWRHGEGGQVPNDLWKKGSPGSGQRCGVLGDGPALKSAPCFGADPADERRVVCESEPTCVLNMVSGKQVPGYVGPKGHCYARIAGQFTHPDAAAQCEAAGAHLAAFETAGELAKLPGANLTSSDVWVGATRRACAGNAFVWTTSGAIVPEGGLPFWGGIEPNNSGGNEGCAVMGRDRLMGDLECTTKKGAFCERDF